MINDELAELASWLGKKSPNSAVSDTRLGSGGILIRVEGVRLPAGWNRTVANVLFIAPPGYPAAAPDCFWVEPAGLRLGNGATPGNSNDSNPIPNDPQPSRSVTWFSWHAQGWNPSTCSLKDYFQMIFRRLETLQ
jgi:hypothetical protein